MCLTTGSGLGGGAHLLSALEMTGEGTERPPDLTLPPPQAWVLVLAACKLLEGGNYLTSLGRHTP